MIRRRVLMWLLAVVLGMGAAWRSVHAWEPRYSYEPLCAQGAPAGLEFPPSRPPACLGPSSDSRCTASLAPLCPPPLFDVPVSSSTFDPRAGALLRRAWRLAASLAEEGRYEEASLQLQVVERALPEIEDYVAWRRAQVAWAAGRVREAVSLLDRARRSPSSSLRVRAEVLRVQWLLRQGAPEAMRAFRKLRARYPRLSREPDLWLARAQWLQDAKRPVHAGYVLRRLLRDFPDAPAARQAEASLASLRAAGVRIAPLSVEERLGRVERSVTRGARGLAARELTALLQDADAMTPLQRGRLERLQARLARWRADWDAWKQHLEAARHWFASDSKVPLEERRAVLNTLRDAERLVSSRDVERAARALQRLRKGRTWRKLSLFRLVQAVSVAASGGLQEPLEAALAELVRRGAPARIRLRALLEAVGVARDTLLVDWYGGLVEHPRFGKRARYHRARALERLGRWSDAEADYGVLLQGDDFYALWAEQRLGVVRRAFFEERPPERLLAEAEREALAVGRAGRFPARWPVRTPSEALALNEVRDRARPRSDAIHAVLLSGQEGEDDPDEAVLQSVASALREIAAEHGDAFPWLGRAAALLLLGEREAAGEELQEALIAWRQAVGRPIAFVGIESIYRGGARARVKQNWALRRARAALPRSVQVRLGRLAEHLGEAGVAAGFLGADYIASRPRPYVAAVMAAARRHGLDPALLWAVMRVESVYQRRIVSYAGAVGLMQIMPATGRAIAWERGRSEFVPEDLLDPETNLDFAAWYLRSLLDRFEGRLPLAIAAYNGGPHNVRRWMRERPPGMPLDAWLEHIPFGQTWRYVRRVLMHYAAYRAQLGLPMPLLAVSMPREQGDTMGF